MGMEDKGLMAFDADNVTLPVVTVWDDGRGWLPVDADIFVVVVVVVVVVVCFILVRLVFTSYR
jgi:hypothetical protein